jgi:hypothetical protein
MATPINASADLIGGGQLVARAVMTHCLKELIVGDSGMARVPANDPEPATPKGDTAASTDFLQHFAPDTPWVLTAIDPEATKKPTETQVFLASSGADRVKQATAWIERFQGRWGIYFTVNRVSDAWLSREPKKTSKTDIGWLGAIHVDADPRDGHDLAEEQTRIRELLLAHQPAFDVIVFSGAGFQAYYLLKEPVAVDDPDKAAALNKKLEQCLGGDHCHDISRIMRLPGTVNMPNELKRRKGRVPALAALVVVPGDWKPRYTYADLEAAAKAWAPASGDDGAAAATDDDGASDSEEASDNADAPDHPALRKLPMDVPERYRRMIVTGKHASGDRSRGVYAVVQELLFRCGCSDDLIVSILLDPTLGISAHVREQGNPARYARAQIAHARKQGPAFKRSKEGKGPPTTNQDNIRLALHKLGIRVSYDSFADRMLIDGLDGQPTRHLGDAELVRLYLLIDKRYDFRPGMDFFTQVISQTARRNSFHPVRDYLADLVWDDTPRLDTWLCTYAGAADTPYVRAVGRLMLVAAVRRVRQPGCKFDEMPVWESAQGLNKSQALRLLAVRDEWFSDDLPLNADGKEVIERTRGRWIVEAAELRGLRKGDVEHLKSFLGIPVSL